MKLTLEKTYSKYGAQMGREVGITRAVLLLAMHRAGCINPKGPRTRDLWRETYRALRQDSRALYHVEKQLVAFRGFPSTRGPNQ